MEQKDSALKQFIHEISDDPAEASRLLFIAAEIRFEMLRCFNEAVRAESKRLRCESRRIRGVACEEETITPAPECPDAAQNPETLTVASAR